MFVRVAVRRRVVRRLKQPNVRQIAPQLGRFWYNEYMKVYMVYKTESDHARAVTDWMRDFNHQTGKGLEVINPDSREGADFCRTYDIVEYPTLVAIDINGALQNIWRGVILPTISEVGYYVQEN